MCTLEEAIRVADWMASRRSVPTWEEIRDHFEVSRATAYRWLNHYTDARGIVRERKERELTPGLRRKPRVSKAQRTLSWPPISSPAPCIQPAEVDRIPRAPLPPVASKPRVELPSKLERAYVILTKDMRAYHAVLDAHR